MLIYVAHIASGFHAIRTDRRVYRINSSTFLFHTILPSTSNIFFCFGVRATYQQTFLEVSFYSSPCLTRLVASRFHTFWLSVSLCHFFRLFFTRKKITVCFVVCCCVCFFNADGFLL